jgi:hypothetical protein
MQAQVDVRLAAANVEERAMLPTRPFVAAMLRVVDPFSNGPCACVTSSGS